MTNSRDKGARYEREVAAFFRQYGLGALRGQQFSAANGDPDVIVPEYEDWMWIECKRVEKLNLYKAMEQAKRDANEMQMPVVIHRKNNQESLVTMRLEDWILLAETYARDFERCFSCNHWRDDRCDDRGMREAGEVACERFERRGILL